MGYRRHKITIIVTHLELDSPDATTKSMSKLTHSQETLPDLHLLWFDFLDRLLIIKQLFVLLCIE